jgi:hypothetical protein
MVARVNESAITGGLAGAAGAAAVATAGVVLIRRQRPYQPAAHAIAGRGDTDPLREVLQHGLGGLTVPVVPGPRGELFLGEGGPQPGRTLRRLILSPLLARARAGGGRLVRDQRVPFRLVVEFAGPNRDAEILLRAYRMLDQQLRDHGTLLSRCDEGQLHPGAVTVSVAGIVDVREILSTQTLRYAFADGTFDDVGSRSAPAALVPMISEQWSRRFGWDGREEIPAEERHQLHALVRSAHEDGRTVRISGLTSGSRKERRAVWAELGAAGVDVIADQDHRALAQHLRRHPVSKWVPREPLPTRAVRRGSPRPTAPRPDRHHEPV